MNKAQTFLRLLIVLISVPVYLGPPAGAMAIRAPAAPNSIEDIIAKYRQEIPRLMAQENIPGLAVALVDDQGILWTEGFGFTDTDRRVPITPDTIFSVQSMSKLFTALGVMRAVQAGVLDLDAPIITYLPDFSVHSIFEEHPERKITLRHLLSHTAGFTHEAPVGNNFDADTASFEAHIRSISDTWLRFPVGTGYAYSNLGIDLAGYILETVTGQPFPNYERDQVFRPLGMARSSFDRAVFSADSDRAIGHSSPLPTVPLPEPMVAAGGMYASANDLARFIEFALNDGTLDGQSVLSPELLEEMTTVQFPVTGQRYGYALGVARTGWYRGRNADLFSHGGAGFGFLSDLWWLPELKVGITILTNSADHSLQGRLALQILDDLVHRPGPYYERLTALHKGPVTEGDGRWRPPATLARDIVARALPPNPEESQRHVGDYLSINFVGINPAAPPSRVYEQDGALYLDWAEPGESDGGQHRLYEVAPDLFFTEIGEVLDFGVAPPTYRNIELKRVGAGPSPPAWGVLAVSGLVMLSALLALPARPIWRRLQRGAEARPPAPDGAAAALVNGVVIAGILCGLASIALLVAIPRLIYSGFLGWLAVPIWQKLLLHAPLGLALCAVALVALAVPAWRRGWWTPGRRWHYMALVVAALVETVLLAGWRLIGLG